MGPGVICPRYVHPQIQRAGHLDSRTLVRHQQHRTASTLLAILPNQHSFPRVRARSGVWALLGLGSLAQGMFIHRFNGPGHLGSKDERQHCMTASSCLATLFGQYNFAPVNATSGVRLPMACDFWPRYGHPGIQHAKHLHSKAEIQGKQRNTASRLLVTLPCQYSSLYCTSHLLSAEVFASSYVYPQFHWAPG